MDTPKVPEGDALRDLFRRTAEGDESTLPVVRECLQRPGALEAYGDRGRIARQKLVTLFTGNHRVNREAMLARLELLREELAGPTPTPWERLLAERIVACLLHLEYLDLNYSCQVEQGNMTEMKIHLTSSLW